MDNSGRWRGVVIAQGLHDPAVINDLRVTRYAHFWRADELVVVYDDARFSMHRHDQSTWKPAVEHGLEQGLRREWLDFPTDDSVGTLG